MAVSENKKVKADAEENSIVYFQLGLIISLLITIGLFYIPLNLVGEESIYYEDTFDETVVIYDIMAPSAPAIAAAPEPKTEKIEIVKEKPEPVKTPPKQETETTPKDSPADDEGEGEGEEGDKVFNTMEIDEMPSLMGGRENEYIQRYTRYPDFEKGMGLDGVVWVSFTVGLQGEIYDVKVEKGVTGGLDKEAVRVIKSMPNWKPAMRNGRPVKVRVTKPIHFKLRVE